MTMTDLERRGMSPAEQMSRRQSALSLAHYSMPDDAHQSPSYPDALFKRAEQFLAWIEEPVSRRCDPSAKVVSLASSAGP